MKMKEQKMKFIILLVVNLLSKGKKWKNCKINKKQI